MSRETGEEKLVSATTTQVRSAEAAAASGRTVTFTATVASAGAGTPTGTVTFMDGKDQLGTVPLNASAQAKFVPRTPLAAGNHAITAVYRGNGTFAQSSSAVWHQSVIRPAVAVWRARFGR